MGRVMLVSGWNFHDGNNPEPKLNHKVRSAQPFVEAPWSMAWARIRGQVLIDLSSLGDMRLPAAVSSYMMWGMEEGTKSPWNLPGDHLPLQG